jgi:hypothetical protein
MNSTSHNETPRELKVGHPPDLVDRKSSRRKEFRAAQEFGVVWFVD